MIITPYKSAYYDINYFYERFGNYVVHIGQEIYVYITDIAQPGIEPYRYSISNRMNVYDYKKQEFVKISYNTQYPTVNLFNVVKNKTVTSLLHRLYMISFCYIPGCESLDVNHIDGNKMNYHPSNLEWMTHKENMIHAFTLLMNDKLKLSDQDIIELIEMYNNGNSVRYIANKFNISIGYIYDIIRNRTNSSKLDSILNQHPITRDKFVPKLSDNDILVIIDKYNNGSEYFELAEEYNVDRSYMAKLIKKYAKSHPGSVNLRELKKLTSEMAEAACIFFQNNKNISDTYLLYTLCLQEIGLDDTPSNRKCISNLYNGKTYKNISSKYKFQ